ncbi:MAG TPA: hypothetical protein VIM55_17190 [Mucilaginibacter sp.]
MNWYYKIWVDAIATQKQSKTDRSSWKLYSIVFMSVLQGLNLFTLLLWIKVVINRHLLLMMPVSVFNAKPLNGFISVIITFFLPFLILNYLLIFTNERYKRLAEQYPAQNGKLFKKYALWTVGLLIIPAVIKFMFFG